MKRTKLILLTLLIIISLFPLRALAVSVDTPIGSSAELLVSSGDVDSRLEGTPLGNITDDALLFVSDADDAMDKCIMWIHDNPNPVTPKFIEMVRKESNSCRMVAADFSKY